MGKAKLNIWVRDKNCRVVKNAGHLHIYNCLREEVFAGWVIKDGHAEVEMPPGCYIIVAGMQGRGNIYSDKTVAIVKCGDEACVNLILPDYKESGTKGNPHPQIAPKNLLSVGGCAVRLIPALGVHAIRKNIDPEEAFNVLIETAEIDRRQLVAALENDAKELKKHLKEIPPEEKEEAKKYMTFLEKIKKMVDKKGIPPRSFFDSVVIVVSGRTPVYVQSASKLADKIGTIAASRPSIKTEGDIDFARWKATKDYNLILIGRPVDSILIKQLADEGISTVDWATSPGEWEYIPAPYGGRDVLIIGGKDESAVHKGVELLIKRL